MTVFDREYHRTTRENLLKLIRKKERERSLTSVFIYAGIFFSAWFFELSTTQVVVMVVPSLISGLAWNAAFESQIHLLRAELRERVSGPWRKWIEPTRVKGTLVLLTMKTIDLSLRLPRTEQTS